MTRMVVPGLEDSTFDRTGQELQAKSELVRSRGKTGPSTAWCHPSSRRKKRAGWNVRNVNTRHCNGTRQAAAFLEAQTYHRIQIATHNQFPIRKLWPAQVPAIS